MISFLRGKLFNKGKNYIIIEANNVGYQVFVNPIMYAELEVGQAMEVYTHQYVREDALDLYGFKSVVELEMFELLISISGVGPKSALGVLAIASVQDVQDSIIRGDSTLLTKVSGIGRKTAERIILELREKISGLAAFHSVAGAGGAVRGDEIDALVSLGYSVQQAREALSQVDSKIKDSGERIREVLKKLSR